jgi:hypothetical protein
MIAPSIPIPASRGDDNAPGKDCGCQQRKRQQLPHVFHDLPPLRRVAQIILSDTAAIPLYGQTHPAPGSPGRLSGQAGSIPSLRRTPEVGGRRSAPLVDPSPCFAEDPITLGSMRSHGFSVLTNPRVIALDRRWRRQPRRRPPPPGHLWLGYAQCQRRSPRQRLSATSPNRKVFLVFIVSSSSLHNSTLQEGECYTALSAYGQTIKSRVTHR